MFIQKFVTNERDLQFIEEMNKSKKKLFPDKISSNMKSVSIHTMPGTGDYDLFLSPNINGALNIRDYLNKRFKGNFVVGVGSDYIAPAEYGIFKTRTDIPWIGVRRTSRRRYPIEIVRMLTFICLSHNVSKSINW